MPSLRCTADNCVYNNEHFCSRGEINVSGFTACTSDDTCCASFYEGQGGAQNASGEPTPYMEVACQAKNCTHNSNCKCHADSIDVSGSGANRVDDTCCSSFYPE